VEFVNNVNLMRLFLFTTFLTISLISLSQTKTEILSLNKYFNKLQNTTLNDDICPECFIRPSIEKEFNWNLDKSYTYDNIISEIGDDRIDYRYFLIIGKMAGKHIDKESWLIGNYYKYKFIELALEQGSGLINEKRDSLKMSLIQTYDVASVSQGFRNYQDFKNYSTIIAKYTDDLLPLSFKYTKGRISYLYRIKASVLYDTYYKTEKLTSKLDDVLLNLKYAIDYDPKNRIAIRDRANIKLSEIKDYSGAAEDFIREYTLRIEDNKNPKNFYTKCYPVIEKIGDCYYNLDNYREVIKWYNKAISEINTETKKTKYWMGFSIEEMRKDEGVFHYRKAICHKILKEPNLACAELRKAIEAGYMTEETRKMFQEYNCK
jgi:tetratricopeptide (TPR) repeat protein